MVIEGNFTDILGDRVEEWEVGELIKPEFGDLKRFEIILYFLLLWQNTLQW